MTGLRENQPVTYGRFAAVICAPVRPDATVVRIRFTTGPYAGSVTSAPVDEVEAIRIQRGA